MTEGNLTKHLLLSLSKALPTLRIFRNNTGVGWVGRMLRNIAGTVTLADARPLHAGLCTGSSDLIGWVTIQVGPEMVGRKIAVFTAIEVKTATGKATEAQLNFMARVREAGGIAFIANDAVKSPADLKTIVEGFQK